MKQNSRAAFFASAFTLAIGILVTACGGGEKTTPTPPPTQALQPTAAPRPTPPPTPRPTATPTPAAMGRLSVAVASLGDEGLEPRKGGFAAFGVLGVPMYDYLLWVDSEGLPAPGVSEKWEMAPDAKSWTYRIRSGMKFHNGAQLTSGDVKFSIDQLLLPDSRSSYVASWKASVAGVETTAANEVRVTLKTAWPGMPFAATPRGQVEGAVLPGQLIESVGIAKFLETPVGSGPWRLGNFVRGARYTYRAVGALHPFRPTPKYENLDITLVPEESTRLAMLKTGQANMVQVGVDAALGLSKGGGLKVLTIPDAANGVLLFFGTHDPRTTGMPITKKEVRKALTMAVDRKELAATLLGGLVSPGGYDAVVSTSSVMGYDPGWQPEAYDPRQARQLLTEAGYPNGFSFDVFSAPVPLAPWMPRVVEAVASYWKDIGVNARINLLDYGAMTQKMRARPQPNDLMGAAGATFMPIQADPTVLLNAAYGSRGISLALNLPEVDRLIAEASAAVDQAQKARLIRQAVELAHSQYVQINLGIGQDFYGADDTIAGWTTIRAGSLGLLLETVMPK